MAERTSVLWRSAELRSTEHATFERTSTGWRITTIAVLPLDDEPAHASATIALDDAWRVTHATLEIVGASRRLTHELRHADGRWTVDGVPHRELDRCDCVDLGWTPSTNTIAIRQLDLRPGASGSVRAAWFRFPELRFEADEQHYTRLSQDRWRYRAGPYDFVLHVEDGVVTTYGDGLWTSVARSHA